MYSEGTYLLGMQIDYRIIVRVHKRDESISSSDREWSNVLNNRLILPSFPFLSQRQCDWMILFLHSAMIPHSMKEWENWDRLHRSEFIFVKPANPIKSHVLFSSGDITVEHKWTNSIERVRTVNGGWRIGWYHYSMGYSISPAGYPWKNTRTSLEEILTISILQIESSLGFLSR